MDTRIIKQAIETRANGYHWSIDDQIALLKLIGQLADLAATLSKEVQE